MKPLFALIASLLLFYSHASAATVDTRISTGEAYVGVPVTLQIAISNASDYEAPSPPVIDGCEVRSAGAPAQSTQITIINGRRRQSSSVTLQYLVTPRREGSFTIPAMTLQVDGKAVKTQPQRFVASRSETGDLLFVSIEGSRQKVYVGQPIDLTLRIWLKPFRDPKTGQTLSEGDMWGLLADSTSWGGFEPRLKELAQKRQRPGGREVLREDSTGQERVYYLYEIEATIYPKRAGKIDADDVQIVFNYPTQLGETRGAMGGLFDDDMFGNSPLSQMMRDDFFDSAFGRRLAVTAARPIVGQASVDATDVLPVPSEGRPSDYRGAVGRYQIVTQATPTDVDAGDPITLNIGITGSGAMELVQAPPLADMPELTSNFKVADESLAGFVQGDAKLFSTTIRPRQAGVTEIPAIRFSFFDPDSETFQTVASQAIPITVRQSETLALDSIVGPKQGAAARSASSAPSDSPDFTNYSGGDVLSLKTPPPRPSLRWWVWSLIVPPAIWLAAAMTRSRGALSRSWLGAWLGVGVASFQSPYKRCMAAIERAASVSAVQNAVVTYVLRRLPGRLASHSRDGLPGETPVELDTLAAAALRTAGLYELAGETESWLAHASRLSSGFELVAADDVAATNVAAGANADDRLSASSLRLKSTAVELVNRLEAAIAERKRHPVRVARATAKVSGKSRAAGARQMVLMLCAFSGALMATGASWANPPAAPAASNISVPPAELADSAGSGTASDAGSRARQVSLTRSQQETLLSEADAAYTRGMQNASSHPADAKEAFEMAAQKYQLLVDSGIINDKLFINLGNAYMQGGSLGRAIANYEKAIRLAPRSAQGRQNLAFARTQVALPSGQAGGGSSNGAAAASGDLSVQHVMQLARVASHWAVPVLCIASMAWWSWLILRMLSGHRAGASGAVAGVVLSLVAGGALWFAQTDLSSPQSSAIIVVSKVALRAGDGEQFAVVATLDQAEGHRVERLASRGGWTQIQTVDGQLGWLPSRDVEPL